MYAIQIDGETVGDQLHERGEETSIRIATPAEEGIGALIECPCGWEGERDEIARTDDAAFCPGCGDELEDLPGPDPADWLNSARITVSPGENAVHCVVSVGDPRGGFAFTVRQLDNGRLVMHTPHPGQSFAHAPLTPLHSGTYGIGHGWDEEARYRIKALTGRRNAINAAIGWGGTPGTGGLEREVDELRKLRDEIDRQLGTLIGAGA